MNRYFVVPILTSLRQNTCAMYNDETRDITSIEQMAIYAIFNHSGKISEHFVGIKLVSKMVGTYLSAANVLSVFESYFQKLEYSHTHGIFAAGRTNVPTQEKKYKD